jgi:ABC-type sugar transport system ATPase subunit
MVEMKGVTKYFGALKALDNVSLDVYDGEKVVIIEIGRAHV